MAKSKSKKSNVSMIITISIIVLAVLTLCTLFMPVLSSFGLVAGKATEGVKATGADLIKIAFTGELGIVEIAKLSEGEALLYGMKMAEETAFVTTVFAWGYLTTLVASAMCLVLAVLSLLGMKFKLLNTICGVALILLAIATFVFGIIVASKNTSVTDGLITGEETGVKCVISLGTYLLIGALIAGGMEVYKAKK